MKETARHVRELYDAGTPLFTSESLKTLAEQLEKYRNGVLAEHKFALTGINGAAAEIFVDPSESTTESNNPNCHMIW